MVFLAMVNPDETSSFSSDRESVRGLETVGAVTVLEAMVEQRVRRSSIPPPPPSLELCPEDDIVG